MSNERRLPMAINTVDRMIAPRNVSVGLSNGTWGRAVSEPYYALSIKDRLCAAWWVFTGKAQAMRWPTHEELNLTLTRGGDHA